MTLCLVVCWFCDSKLFEMAEQEEQNVSSIPIDAISNLRITSIWTFLLSIQWSEAWLIGLVTFHAICLLITFVTFRFYRLQIFHFLVMAGMVYFAENINEIAAMNWSCVLIYGLFHAEKKRMKAQCFSRGALTPEEGYTAETSFSKYQYFDSRGMFISLVFSAPLLLNTIIIVILWIYRTFATMTELKTLQLKRKAKKAKTEKSE